MAATLTPAAAEADASPALTPGSFDPVLAANEDLIQLPAFLNAYDELLLADAVRLETTFGDLRGQILIAQAAAGTSTFVAPSGSTALSASLGAAQKSLATTQGLVSRSLTIAPGPRAQLRTRLDALASALEVLVEQPPSSVPPTSLDPLLTSDEQLLTLVGSLENQGQLSLADTLITLEQPLADVRGQLVAARVIASATGPFSDPPSSLASVLKAAQKALADADGHVSAAPTVPDAARGEFHTRIAALAAALAALATQAPGISISGLKLQLLPGLLASNAVVQATLTYVGPQPVEPVSVRVSLDGGAAGQGRVDRVDLEPGRSTTVWVPVNLAAHAAGDLAVSVIAVDAAGTALGQADGSVSVPQQQAPPAPIDQVHIGDPVSESAHQVAQCDSGLCYALDVAAGQPFVLHGVEAFDGRGSAELQVLVNGQVVMDKTVVHDSDSAGTEAYDVLVDDPAIIAQLLQGKVQVQLATVAASAGASSTSLATYAVQ